MEFWGVEVKSGEPLKVVPGDDMVLHLSQACLGEMKKDKGNESVCLFVNVDEKKLVLGTLFSQKLPQQQFDLVFEKEFELSHNWKNGSVYFYGYKANNPFDEYPLSCIFPLNNIFLFNTIMICTTVWTFLLDSVVPFVSTDVQGDEESDESDAEEEIPLTVTSVKSEPETPAEAVKGNASKGKEFDAGKQKVKIVEPTKDANPEDDDDSSDDLMSEDEDDSEDGDEDDSDDSESDDESDEETPKKPESSKKRAADSAIKTPVQDKKAKATPQKTDGKKVSGHVATPYPSKQAGKTPATKPNQQTPQSGGSHSCKSCPRAFGSEKALESHTKAKHSAQK